MPLKLVTIPCLQDNYAFLLGNTDTKEAALVDVPEAAPINRAVAQEGWRLTTVLLTHHHADHVQGLDQLERRDGLRIIGAKADQNRLPPLDQAVSCGDSIAVLDTVAQVFDVSGHTIGHIAFHIPTASAAFTGDSLMALGCGRLFEGDAAMMWASLQRLRALPADTLVCSGHEYTATNARFAETLRWQQPALTDRIARTQQAAADGQPTVPSALSLELATNPFLNADSPDLAQAIGLPGADPTRVFAEVRARRDRF